MYTIQKHGWIERFSLRQFQVCFKVNSKLNIRISSVDIDTGLRYSPSPFSKAESFNAFMSRSLVEGEDGSTYM